jgi:hypothetical protein
MAGLANAMGDEVDRVLAAGASDVRVAEKLRDVRQGSRTGAMVEIPDDARAAGRWPTASTSGSRPARRRDPYRPDPLRCVML